MNVCILDASTPILSAVATHLGACPQFRVKAVVSQGSKKPQFGPQIHFTSANLDNYSNVRTSLEGADACVLDVDFENEFLTKEAIIKRWKIIADVCKDLKLEKIIFNTETSNSETTGINCSYLDVKAIVHEYMLQIGLRKASVVTPLSYEDFLNNPKRYFRKTDKILIDLPIGDDYVDLISLKDMGMIVQKILTNFNYHSGKTHSLAAEILTANEIAETFSKFSSYEVVNSKMTINEYRLKKNDKNLDLANFFHFRRKKYVPSNTYKTNDLFGMMLSLSDWVQLNNDKLNNVFSKIT